MRVTDKYVLFWKGILSNFASTPYISHDGIQFCCTEQEFMYRKAIIFGDKETAALILQSTDPKTIKHLGRQVKHYNDHIWSKFRYDVMYKACKAKFTQNDKARKVLLSYPDKEFVEANPFDTIWAIGLKEDDPKATDSRNWKGQNLLGQILTRIKNELINE